MNVILKKIKSILLLSILGIILYSCSETETFQDFYKEGKEQLGIRFKTDAPSPDSGIPGTEVTFKVAGLVGKEGQFDFLINNEKAEVKTITDSTVTIIVPQLVSSGISSIIMDGQVFFGPRFKVLGNINIDPNFGLKTGTDGAIYDYARTTYGYELIGAFRNIEKKSAWNIFFNGIAGIRDDGSVITNTVPSNSTKYTGATNGSILSVSKLSDGKMIVSGSFRTFDGKFVNGITRINADGSLDLNIGVPVVNLTPDIPANGFADVPFFNGGTPDQIIVKSFVNQNDQIIAIGNLTKYAQADYSQSTRTTTKYNYTDVKSIIRMDKSGNLDVTYHSVGQGFSGGGIEDGFIQSDGKIVVVGGFTQFDGKTANSIVRIDANGNYDNTFNVGGTGANGSISSVQYNPTTGKILVTGVFTQFNGKPYNGVVMLNAADGSIDTNFVMKTIGGGRVTFARSLNNGRVLLSGNFLTYDGVTRKGFLLLENNGNVIQNFNVAGSFIGQIYSVIETTSSLGNPALILMGSISRFDDVNVGNILKVEIKTN